MKKPEEFDHVSRNVMFSASEAAVASEATGRTQIQIIRASVEAALTHAILHGMIKINPYSEWASWQGVNQKFTE